VNPDLITKGLRPFKFIRTGSD